MKSKSPQLIAFLTVAIDLLGFGIVIPLLPLYGDRLLADRVSDQYHGLMIGLLMMSFSLMQFLFAPGWGRLSDRIGRRPVLLIGLAGSVVFYGLFAYASWVESLEVLFLSRIGAGIAGATIGTAQAVIADCTPRERRARGMALIGMAFGIGFTIGPVIGALSASGQADERLSPYPGIAASALSFVAFCLALLLLPETRPAEGASVRRPWFDLEGWKLALGYRPVAIPLLTFFVATLAFASFESTVARYAHYQLKYELWEMGYLFAYFGVILMVTQGAIVRPLVTRVGEIPMSIAGVILMLLGLILVALLESFDSLAAVLGATAATVMGFACLTPSAQALISRRSSALRQGEVLGVNQAASAIARILGPLMGNLLYGGQKYSHPTWPLYAGVVLLAIALVLASFMRQDQGDVPVPA